jgi:phage/plasmid-associated DNA primase
MEVLRLDMQPAEYDALRFELEPTCTNEEYAEMGIAGAAVALARRMDGLAFCTELSSSEGGRRIYRYHPNEGLWKISSPSDLASKSLKYLREIFGSDSIASKSGHTVNFTNLGTKLAIIHEALPHLVDPTAEGLFNSKSDLLPTKGNQVVNLTTGVSRDRCSDDMFTMEIPVEWDPTADMSATEKFVREVCCEDDAKVAYLRRLLGYMLVGGNALQKVFIFHGEKNSGKSTLVDMMQAVLGPLSALAKKELILKTNASADAQAASPFFMVLLHRRFASASELPKYCRISDDVVKMLTNTTFTARGLHRDPIAIVVSFKVVIDTNHLPEFPSDPALWKRIVIVPFIARFTSEADVPVDPESTSAQLAAAGMDPRSRTYHKDTNFLKDFINAGHLQGFLRWLVAGAVEYNTNLLVRHLDDPLVTPDIVSANTNSHKDRSDILKRFVDSCLVYELGAMTTARGVYKCYQDWCKEVGEDPMGEAVFGRGLSEIPGIKKKKLNSAMMYRDVKPLRKDVKAPHGQHGPTALSSHHAEGQFQHPHKERSSVARCTGSASCSSKHASAESVSVCDATPGCPPRQCASAPPATAPSAPESGASASLRHPVDDSAGQPLDSKQHLLPTKGGMVVDLDTMQERRRTKDDTVTFELPIVWKDAANKPSIIAEWKDRFDRRKEHTKKKSTGIARSRRGEGDCHRRSKSFLVEFLNAGGCLRISSRCCMCGVESIARISIGRLGDGIPVTFRTEACVMRWDSATQRFQPGRVDVGGLDERGTVVKAIEVYNTNYTTNEYPRDGIEWFEVSAESVISVAGGEHRDCEFAGHRLASEGFSPLLTDLRMGRRCSACEIKPGADSHADLPRDTTARRDGVS